MLCLKSQQDYKFKIVLLDDREFKFHYEANEKCEQMLADVTKILNLEEKEYFGFKFIDSDLQQRWIDLNKSIKSQFKSVYITENHEIVVYFNVKFYITDPCKLNHELTRYLYYLQLRKDILDARLVVKFDYAVDLFAYFLQDELGDYNPKRDIHDYASQYEFIPNQSFELEKAAEAKHMKLKGMSQEKAEMNFLNTVKWLDMYGVDMHPVLDDKNVEHLIGLTPTGISVYYQNKTKLISYFWPRINKLNYRGNKFILTVNQTNVLTFILNSKSTCKNLWKSCVDHHKFFRIKTVYEEPAKINTASVMNSKSTKINKSSNKVADSNKLFIKRVPAKRKQLREKPVQIESKTIENGELVYHKISSSSDKNDSDESSKRENFITPVKNNRNTENMSPVLSAKSVKSFKYPKQTDKRPESASENENFASKRGEGNRGRSRKANEASQYNETINTKQNGVSNESETDNEIKLLYKHASNQRIVQRSSSNRSNKSNKSNRSNKSRRHHRSNSRNSINCKKSYDQETCHETEIEEQDINDIEKKRQIRRRKRSKSPGGTTKPPEEILQHIKYDLIQTSGLSSDQLKEIPFVKIETSAPPFRISPHQNKRRISPHRRRSGDFRDSKTSIAYLRDGNGQIAKTNKLNDGVDFKTVNREIISTGSAINHKLTHNIIEPSTNVGFSADSGCEDMINPRQS